MIGKIPDTIMSIVLDVTGEKTKSRFMGTFRIKAVLTHADVIAIERMYSQLLPRTTSDTSEDAKLRASTISELSVRIVDGPEWWNGTRYGQLLIDREPLYQLLIKCNEAEQDWSSRLEEQANQVDSENVIEGPSKP